jgi:hypothetical protein
MPRCLEEGEEIQPLKNLMPVYKDYNRLCNNLLGLWDNNNNNRVIRDNQLLAAIKRLDRVSSR